MADNITAPASGSVLATKDVGGVHYPRNLITDEAGADAVGVVGASPPANTVLGRLKAIADGLTTLSGHVDGLETLQGTSNTTLTTLNGLVDGIETLIAATNTALGGPLAVTGTFWPATQPVSLTTVPALVAGSAIIGKVGIDQTTDGTTNKANIDASLKSGTAARTSVSSGVASATILASNANRKGASIFNSDANALLLDLSGGTAAATRCQARLTQYQNYEIPAGFTGAITGIWEGDGSGIADVVEFT